MAEFKNPKLVLGGAIIGGFTQEPEDHPIMGIVTGCWTRCFYRV